MGRRTTVGMARAALRVEVTALHPDDADARPCALRFTGRGVLVETRTRDDPEVLLRVPWWAVHGFSADDVALLSDGTVLQALDLVTDAGRLRLALRADGVAVALSLLSVHSSRWRHWRVPASRWVGHRAARARAAGRRAARACGAGRRGAGRVRSRAGTPSRRPAVVLAAVGVAVTLVVSAAGALAAGLGPVSPSRPGAPGVAEVAGASHGTSLGTSLGPSGMAALIAGAHLDRHRSAAHLARATSPPPPAPTSIAEQPALASHEVFGFVPYWTLDAQAGFDVNGFTTLAYFAVGANANGTLDESGTGWDGYESQDFADLVARAHAAGARVVLTVNCFSPNALAALTSQPAAASTLASSIVGAIAAKRLDGVNLDFEGGDPAERPGLTTVVATVAAAVHAANPHFQVTVDTNGESAGDPGGFYDVRGLAAVTDGLFVMAYGLNYSSPPSGASPITSSVMSDATEAEQYAAAVPPSKVIFGTSYFGYSWATTNGTMGAHAVATGTPVTYAQVMASGHPMYWNAVTETAWTSYESHGQWYEDYVDDPESVYLVTLLAQRDGFAGVGAWALGMDGNDPQMTAALDGNAPPTRAGPAGPTTTAPSKPSKPSKSSKPAAPAPAAGTTTTVTSPVTSVPPSTAVNASTPTAGAAGTTGTTPTTTTTPTTGPTGPTATTGPPATTGSTPTTRTTRTTSTTGAPARPVTSGVTDLPATTTTTTTVGAPD